MHKMFERPTKTEYRIPLPLATICDRDTTEVKKGAHTVETYRI